MLKTEGSAVSAVGEEVRPHLGLSSKLRHSLVITDWAFAYFETLS